MLTVLKKVLSILDESFDGITNVLKKCKVNSYFEMKIIIYRNYDSSANLLIEKTPYEVKT